MLGDANSFVVKNYLHKSVADVPITTVSSRTYKEVRKVHAYGTS